MPTLLSVMMKKFTRFNIMHKREDLAGLTIGCGNGAGLVDLGVPHRGSRGRRAEVRGGRMNRWQAAQSSGQLAAAHHVVVLLVVQVLGAVGVVARVEVAPARVHLGRQSLGQQVNALRQRHRLLLYSQICKGTNLGVFVED